MRALLVVLAIGCGDDIDPRLPDAPSSDASNADALPVGVPDFFGEPCSPPSTLGVINVCRTDLPYPKAYCTPDAICRPFCHSVSVAGEATRTCERVGGVEVQAFPTSPAHVCYCVPP